MTYRILSFCGGGIRGLLCATLLDRLSKAVDFDFIGQADMLAGTSTGAIISSLITAGLTPEELVLFYRPGMQAGMIAHNQPSPDAPRFESGWLDKLIASLNLPDPTVLGRPLGEIERTLALASFQIGGVVTQGGAPIPWSPVLFHNFPGSAYAGVALGDAMHASGAMCGMAASYPIAIGDQTMTFVDGAFLHHDPTVPAIALAMANGIKIEEISVLDFGTGFMQNYITADTTGWGSDQWMSGDASIGTVPPLLVNLPATPVSPICNMMLNGTSTSLMPDMAAMMLGSRFAYLNPDLGTSYVAEDATSESDLDILSQAAAGFDITAATDILNTYWQGS